MPFPELGETFVPAHIEELTLRIVERANQLAQQRVVPPGGELALWLDAEAEVKRELKQS